LQDGLGADCELRAKLDQLAGCGLGERQGSLLDAADDAAVFSVFSHRDDDEIADASADVGERSYGSETGEDTGELVALDVRHPYVVEGLAELVEARDSVDDDVPQDHVRLVQDEEVHELGGVPGAEAAVVDSFGFEVKLDSH